MRGPLLALLVAALGASLAAQSPRDQTQVNIGSIGGVDDPSVATDGDLTAIVYENDFSAAEIYCVTSDGRGVGWSAPVRVDSDPGPILSSKDVDDRSVGVSGNTIYAIWEDHRECGFKNLFFTRSTDGGQTFELDRRLPFTPPGCQPAGNRDIVDWDAAYSGSNVFVGVVVEQGAIDEVYAMTSSDGGVSFSPPIAVSTATGVGSVEAVEVAASGSTGHVVWIDTRAGSQFADVFVRCVSSSGGSCGSEIRVNSSAPGQGDADGDIEIEASGSVVVVAFHENGVSPVTYDMNRVAVSTNGGLSYGNDVQVGSADPLSVDADDLDVAIEGGSIVVVWDDNRNSGPLVGDDIITSYSTDLGVSWSADRELTTGVSGQRASITSGGGVVAIVWEDDVPGGDVVRSFFTRNGGATWTGPVTVSASSGDCDDPVLAYNSLYGNVVVAWPADDFLPFGYENDLFAGGYRPQTLTPVGFTGGASFVNFGLSRFDGTDPFALVVASGSTGSFPLTLFGDARDVGLTFDALFNVSITSPALFLTSLDAGGAGSTTPFPVNLTGVQLHAAAVSFDLSLAVGEITDAVRIDVP